MIVSTDPSVLVIERIGSLKDIEIKEAITNDTIDVDVFLDFITQDEKEYKYGEILKRQGYDISGLRSQDLNANFLPTENIKIPVNIENVLKSFKIVSKCINYKGGSPIDRNNVGLIFPLFHRFTGECAHVC